MGSTDAGNRTPIVAGNWKMNLGVGSARALAEGLTAGLSRGGAGVEVVVFPGFLHLAMVAEVVRGAGIGVGSQDHCERPEGAMTGEVALSQIKDAGAEWALVGHSERRHEIGESDELVRAKLHAALEAGMMGVLCIGETLPVREAGETDAVNARQLRSALEGVAAERLERLVIAYEPVWAIGTGKTASPSDAQGAHAACRGVIAEMFGGAAAGAVRILYGGSMKPGNAAELLAQPDIDGGLIGGASLVAEDFGAIVEAARPPRK